ncbi:hypothetical protein NVP1244A_101 [Vibrio phage 1.244.A._10N.261.54.C3]|nr:hypothetical protein NVP1244A_101 [Vibrio phage 1.244.A._10N.261.54.C3]AUR98729.1 hypothetical protein NVP1255O_101 [Vibrio phage 1.255.O._10N.286.45.F1]
MSDFQMPLGHQKMPKLVLNIVAKAIVHKCHLDVHDRTFVFVIEDSVNFGRFCEYLHNVFTTVGLTAVRAVDQGQGYYHLKLDNGCMFRVHDSYNFDTNLVRGLTASLIFNRPMTEKERDHICPVIASCPNSFLLEVGM